ncbi:MAG: peptidase PmbA [Methanoregulaceae archaeon PtaU1.Bin222]|nr:MAG: peptidase PmbA [Methanoregulaceae archaeon PtaU1.Bin222]
MRWWVAVELIERIVKEGGRRVDELEAYQFSGYSVSARLKRHEIHYASGTHLQGLSLRVIHKGCIGTSATMNPERWEACLDAAIASATLATPQEWKGLPVPAAFDPTPVNYDPGVTPDAETVKTLLGDLVDGTRAYPVEITSGSAEISRYSGTLANTGGVHYGDMESMVSVGIETITGQSTGYEFDASWRMDIDPRKVGERAAYLAYSSLDGKDVASGSYDIVLSPIALSQLLGGVYLPALSGKNVHAGRSRLANLQGQQVMDRLLSLHDDPFHPRGLSSCRWDGEGTPTRIVNFVEQGILREFAYDLKTAYRYGKQSTGSAVRGGHGGSPGIGTHTLTLDGQRGNLMEGRVIHVNDMVGAHTANPLTGDFSVELSNAYLMQDGNVEFPIRKAMLSGNVFDVLMKTGGLSAGERVVGSMVLPEIRLKDLAIIGN